MAYIFKPKETSKVAWLPHQTTLPKIGLVVVDYFEEPQFEVCKDLLNFEIEQGISYPFEDQMSDEEFKAYFLSGEAFVATNENKDVLGIFYVKPNFPGRCDHICNAGFITSPKWRRCGVGKLLGSLFPYVARDLGYKASMFNLVFTANHSSVALWRSLGFQELGVVPNAGRLRGVGLSDAIQFYRDFEKLGDRSF